MRSATGDGYKHVDKATGRLRASEGVAYGLTAVLSAALAFVRAPVYTHWFDPDAYGDYTLVSTGAGLLSSIVLAVFSNVLYRRYDAERRSGRLDSYLSTLMVGTAGSLTLMGLLVWFAGRLLGLQDGTSVLWLVLLTSVLTFQGLVGQVNRMEHQVTAFLVGKLIDPVWQLGAPLMLLAAGLGEFPALATVAVTAASGSLLVAGVWARKVLSGISIRKTNREVLSSALGYGLPLIPLAVAGWVIASSNRYVIQYFLGSEATGVFSMGYSLASMPIGLFSSVMVMTVGPVVWERANTRGGAEALALVRWSATLFMTLACPAALGLGLLGSRIVDALFAPTYDQASVVIFPVALGAVLSGLYSFLVKPWELHEATRRVPLYVGLGAVANLVINLLLVPRLGIAGAAWGSLIAYAAVTLVMTLDARRIYSTWLLPGGRDVLTIVAAGLVMALVVMRLEGVLGDGLLAVAVLVGVGAIVYGVSLVVVGHVLRSEFQGSLRPILVGGIRRLSAVPGLRNSLLR